MRFFLETSNLEELKDGVTTNPTLIASGRPRRSITLQ
jgi:hypothetical protein